MALTLRQHPSSTTLPQLPFPFGTQASSVTLSQRRLWVLCRNGSEAGAAVNVLDHLITLSSIKQASKRSTGISSANHQARQAYFAIGRAQTLVRCFHQGEILTPPAPKSGGSGQWLRNTPSLGLSVSSKRCGVSRKIRSI